MKSTLLNAVILFLPLTVFAQDEARFLAVTKNTEIIVVAEVIERDNSTTFWSGVFASTQQVKYRVLKVLKGQVDSKEILVGHYVVANSYTADKDEPRLSPKLFKVGNKVILLMSSEGASICKKETADSNIQTFCSKSENFGVRPFNQNLVEKIEQTIKN